MQMPDTTRKYHTRDGREVVLHEVVTHNSAGEEVTFPIKGTIIETLPSGRKKSAFEIWQMNGMNMVFGPTPKDIIDLEYV